MDRLVGTIAKNPNLLQSPSRCAKDGAWTRSGCLTCKRRRKRCDETKPSCHHCARLGRTCEGYGSIWTEPLDPSARVFHQPGGNKRRRISLSSSSPARPDGSETDASSRPALSSSSFEGGYGDTRCLSTINPEVLDTPTVNAIRNSTATIQRSYGYASHVTTLEMHYLQYHVEQGSKLLANLETDENPLRALIIPRALMSPLLLKAVCAVSAMHLANRSFYSSNSETAAADYYGRTLRELRTTLAEHPDSTFRDDTILAVAFLCKYEIVRGSVKQWAVHLDALQKLVLSRGGFASLDRETAEFVWGLFMYANNVAKITNRRHFTAITSGPDNVRITKLDSYVGYTEDIIKVCARIADIPFLDIDPLVLGLEVHAIDESLRNWAHSRRQYITPKGITEATLTRLQMVADCFRDAAYIYLHSTLERMSQNPAHTLPPSWSLSISVPKSEALRRCLARVESYHLDHHCEYSALTFPLFIAGCESQTRRERDVVVQSLGMLEANFGIGNVRRAKELLNVLWAGKGSVHWQDALEELQWDLILA